MFKVAHNLTHEAVKKPRLPITYGKGLAKAQRKESLQNWLSGKTDVLVTSKTAGTGLDKNQIKTMLDLSYTLVVRRNVTNSLGGRKR